MSKALKQKSSRRRISSNVVRIQDVSEERALENLNRITGLQFESFPESLVLSKESMSLGKDRQLDDQTSNRETFRLFDGLNK